MDCSYLWHVLVGNQPSNGLSIEGCLVEDTLNGYKDFVEGMRFHYVGFKFPAKLFSLLNL